jgi:hypothetical protein
MQLSVLLDSIVIEDGLNGLPHGARRAVRVLRTGKLKMSARDAARLLGLSHQLTRAKAEDR